eukprot:8591684-Pyramimonas_sp.AAC.3
MVLGTMAAKIARQGGKPPGKQTLYIAIGTLFCAQVGWFTYRVASGEQKPDSAVPDVVNFYANVLSANLLTVSHSTLKLLFTGPTLLPTSAFRRTDYAPHGHTYGRAVPFAGKKLAVSWNSENASPPTPPPREG